MSSNVNQYRRHFKKGEDILKEGETGSHLILLEKGIFDICIQGKKVNSINASISQDFVGEVGAILGTPRTASVIAATECIALCVPKIELDTVLRNSPSLGIKLIRSLCEKMVSASSNLAEIQTKSDSLFETGNTETSLRNYMKGVLYLMELASKDSSGEAGKNLLDYFLRTNPWCIQYGDEKLVLHS
ncbi:MAG: Crp/Fnr family transcriptional regulator [bacterium]